MGHLSHISAMLLFSLLSLWLVLGGPRVEMAIPKINPVRAEPWQKIAANKRAELHSKIPKDWILSESVLAEAKKKRSIVGDFIESLLDPASRGLTALDPTDIVARVANGSVTAVEVTTAFCKRASFAHQLNNNLLQIEFDVALDHARHLDQYWETHGETVGPLHGLPFSMKDVFHIKGFDTSMAYVGWIGTLEGLKGTANEKLVDSELSRELWSLGAIPIAKTSLMQTLWFGETNNNIIGYTMNPFAQGLSCGGSSGGEGAFQALRGSSIGFGTDVGGSVSMPAAFNGQFSIKPSQGRISFLNVANSSPGQGIIPTVVGIIGPSQRALRLMFTSLLSTKPWLHDPDVLDLPWRPELEWKSETASEGDHLSFGFFGNDGAVSPHPPIIRALRMASNALELGGHDIIPWNPPSHRAAEELHPAFTDADGHPDVFERIALPGEPLVPELQPQFGDAPQPPVPLLELYNSTLQLKEWRTIYNDYWTSTFNITKTGRSIDAIILPVAPHAGVVPGKFYHYTYTTFVNVLDYVSIVIPVTFADSNIDVFDHSYTPLNDIDKQNWEAYDPEKYHGAPTSIQLVGRRLEEEKLLSIAKVVVDALAASYANLGGGNL